MAARIHVLEKNVAERIAAGEVVERPASVVKELVENSLDAGARAIVVGVERAGLRLIRVSDDGTGISAEDAPLAVERFATSKIVSADDLTGVTTYGFRGEALPSIAAVSRFELITRPAGSESATRIKVDGGDSPLVSRAASAPGTRIQVRDLFFNTPARRKFLKSPARELALIGDVVQRLAMASPDVAFRLRHEGRDVLTYPMASMEERLAQVLGRDLAGAMRRIQGGGGGTEVSGWIVRPEHARPSRSLEYLFVNRRPVQSRLLSRAVMQAYAELLPVGRFPVAVVFLDVTPHSLDVNIHPRKLEVRFSDEQRVFPAVTRTVRHALLSAGAIRSVAEPPDETLVVQGAPVIPRPVLASEGPVSAITSTLAAGIAERSLVYTIHQTRLPALRLVGQIYQTYLLAESEAGLLLIDQHAAHERVLYERLLRKAEEAKDRSQTLAPPVPVELDIEEQGVLDEFLPAAERLGFAVEAFGPRTMLVRAIPAALIRRSPEETVRRALRSLIEERNGHEALQRLAIATACHTAVRAGDRLSLAEMAALLDDLARTEDPFTCFHGRPTMVRVPLEMLDRWFLRR